MLSLLFLQIETFLFIMSTFIVFMGILHTISVFRLKSGKIIGSNKTLYLFGASLAYMITMLICGF